jgi:3',5'-cyclic AMP phosphodiesterase CpdA
MKNIFFILLLCQFFSAKAQTKNDIFIAKPYLQIGHNPSPESLQLLWHTADESSVWTVELQADKSTIWTKNDEPKFTTVAVKGIAPHRVYNASLTGLKTGSTFKYKVFRDGKEVFLSDAKAPIATNKPYRFVAFGDIGAETAVQKKLAVQVTKNNPDYVVVTGDIVYERGLISEYRSKFWPIYNADKTDTAGAVIMRRIPMISAPGNHDLDTRDLDKYPDALSYFYYWNQPLNGPLGVEGGPLVPNLNASATNRAAFQEAAGDAYLKMSNYSFDYGNAHWLVLDSNPYVDYTDKSLQEWVANDLAKAKDATWKFVMFHHPGFNSSREHFEQQHTRLMSPIFEAGKVDVVFNGHVHNYQRSFPLKFTPDKKGVLLVGGMGNKSVRGRVVTGSWKLDKTYDGKTKTTPNGIIYLVTGAGGQTLYNPEQHDDPDSWQKFTDKFISNIHSLTVADIDGKSMTIKQIDVNGKEIDSFKVTK